MAAEAPSPATTGASAVPKVAIEVDPLYAEAGEAKDVWSLVSLIAPEQDETSEESARAPLKLCAVIDKSGSMSGSKLDLVKETLEFMTGQLTDKDSFSIVAFDSSVSTPLPLCKMTALNKSKALSVVKNIHAGSCTNLSGGLFAGLEALKGGGPAAVDIFDLVSSYLKKKDHAELTIRMKATPVEQEVLDLRGRRRGKKQAQKKSGGGFMQAMSNFFGRKSKKAPVQASPSPMQAPIMQQQSNVDPFASFPQQMMQQQVMQNEVAIGSSSSDEEERKTEKACNIAVKVDESALRPLLSNVKIVLPNGSVVLAMSRDEGKKWGAYLSPPQVKAVMEAGGIVKVKASVLFSDKQEEVFDFKLSEVEEKAQEKVSLPGYKVEAERRKKEKEEGDAASSKKEDEVVSCFLFTDGIANVGVTNTVGICQETTKRMTALTSHFGKSPTIYTFGFGADHSQDMLQAIAETGRGMYYYLENKTQIAPSFADALGGLLSVVLQEVEVELRPLNKAVIKKVETNYPKRDGSNGATIFTIGELFSEERRDTLVQLALPGEKADPASSANAAAVARGELAASFSYLQVIIRYHSIISGSGGQESSILSVYRPMEMTDEMKGKNGQNKEIEKQRIRIETVNVFENVKRMKEQNGGRMDDDLLAFAREEVQKSVATFSASPFANDAMTQQCIADLDSYAADLRDVSSYEKVASKKEAWSVAQHKYQRAATNAIVEEGAMESAYANKKKMSLRAKSKR
eukprot:CAMPEP_0113897350 /NCGR_PEP_ID=MMETSP0780_2-20120614/18620_1 /TAXON_ID=652834 /ORGANISM="Palpitomonas bilix" /LENGTH=742 /DNA_ID=CAMNT_0000888783 /DNA_START=107 /DNA_END=2335 /DNA_ORIENTATION=- /assembly_acc=CAM_ASM_000599